ncbi:chain-length determining protein [Vibrio sp. D404a]|uniref:GumC family protein n=1 Tax=unclassified Vibrio TaxID=2614977 RepID=UPI0025564549|nr:MULTISPECIES: GNVR domain-containing protein [unclassified Vibrio]MDK9735884.1 chain-length determining protein [Vibrio sp. D404a]MDK9796748.1 chain-length determining protein [Vibrio sp. D449a]
MNNLKSRLLQILYGAWRQRYVIVIPMLILPVLGLLVANLTPKKYDSHTSMLIQETAKMNPFLEDIAVSTMLKDRINALKTLLHSRHVLYSVAEELELIDSRMSNFEQEQIISDLSQRLMVTQLGKDFLKISLTSDTPDNMKETLQSVSEHFISQILAPERSSIEDSSNFLAIHIEKRRAALDEAEQALALYRNDNIESTPEIQSQSLNRLAALKQSLSEKEAEMAGVEKSLGTMDQQLSRTNPVIGKIEDQIIDIRSELTLLQAKYTNKHSAVQAKLRELDRLESERKTLLEMKQPNMNSDQLWDIASSNTFNDVSELQPLLVTQLHSLQLVRARFESLKEETKSLKTMIFELENKANNFGQNAKEMYRLQRDVQVKRQLYDELVERYEMAQLTGSLGQFEQNKRIKIIDLPYTPSIPSNMPSFIFVIAGLIAGIGFGVGLAILFELFDSSVKGSAQVEQLLGVPVITVIPNMN